MDKTIKISSEDYKKVVGYKKKTGMLIRIIIERALKRYFSDKQITPWNKLSFEQQENLKTKAKNLIK
jgi:hypothetical protein